MPRSVAVALCLSLAFATTTHAAQGERGVVAAEHALASRVGLEVLEKGGNAIDAAVATAFAVCVVHPSSCGIGGGGFLVAYLADQKRALALDFRETAPRGARRDMYVRDGKVDPKLSRSGGLAVAVPGEVRGLAQALEQHGTISLAAALAPAIHLARSGFPVSAHLARAITRNRDEIAQRPLLARHLLRPDGTPHRQGDEIAFPELAKTLETIARDGPDAFYEGTIAASIAKHVRAAGGILTAADLADYEPVWREPLAPDVRAYRVLPMPPPSSAGVLLQVMGVLAPDDLADLTPTSPAYAHLLTEAMKHGFADRARVYGHPMGRDDGIAALLAPENLAALRKRIAADAVGARDDYGSAAAAAPPPTDGGTAHLSVIDRHGNAVACTTTINTAFGSMVVAGETGIILNNQMDDFSAQPGAPNVYGLVGAEANAIAPGKRPLSSMSPTILTRDDAAVVAAGGSGGPLIITATLQSILDVIVFGMDAATAVATPRLHHQWLPAMLAVEPEIPEATRAALQKRGHQLREIGAMGAVQLVRRTADGVEGASDPRKGGQAAAW